MSGNLRGSHISNRAQENKSLVQKNSLNQSRRSCTLLGGQMATRTNVVNGGFFKPQEGNKFPRVKQS